VAWNVFDDVLLDFAQQFPDFVEAQAAGAVQHCVGAAALAQLIGCQSPDLQATLAQCNAGVDPVTGRSFKRALQAPFHAIRVTGALFHTQGGLDIDVAMQVLRHDGTAFPNLLAAGGAARGVSGNAVWGYLSGNGLLSAVAGGHIAAQTAQHLLAQQLTKDAPE
jgi:fumarate reductase flavoprotein subunit